MLSLRDMWGVESAFNGVADLGPGLAGRVGLMRTVAPVGSGSRGVRGGRDAGLGAAACERAAVGVRRGRDCGTTT